MCTLINEYVFDYNNLFSLRVPKTEYFLLPIYQKVFKSMKKLNKE